MEPAKKRGPRPKMTIDQVKTMRDEYHNNPASSMEYLADKFSLHQNTVYRIINNLQYHDPDYSKSIRKVGGVKKSVYIPDHIQEIKNSFIPAPTTAHRARGQNRTINRFK